MTDHQTSLHDRPGFFDDTDAQAACPIYRLPAELRDRIFSYALSPYQDELRSYDVKSTWVRPLYRAPWRSDVSLLRTCKMVYWETWFKPWTIANHSFWLTSRERAPDGELSYDAFARNLQLVADRCPDGMEIAQVQFFAQMFMLEALPPTNLGRFLALPHFEPAIVTLTIRHTDWWFWEQDATLTISSKLASSHVFPTSVHRICLELETLERKRNQLDSIVEQMKQSWAFSLANGVLLTAQQTKVKTDRWKGSSVLLGKRWCRDEVEPDVLSYYIATVSFEQEAEALPIADVVPSLQPNCSLDRVHGPVIALEALQAAQIGDGVSGEQVLALLQAYQADQSLDGSRGSRRRRRRVLDWGVTYE